MRPALGRAGRGPGLVAPGCPMFGVSVILGPDPRIFRHLHHARNKRSGPVPGPAPLFPEAVQRVTA